MGELLAKTSSGNVWGWEGWGMILGTDTRYGYGVPSALQGGRWCRGTAGDRSERERGETWPGM